MNGPTSANHQITLRDDGIADIVITGHWSLPEVAAFFATLTPMLADLRRRHGRALALIAVQSVQSPLVALDVSRRTAAIKQPGDRNAFVIATMLAKLQIQRLATNRGFGIFTNRAAAEAWLTAY